MSITPLPSFQRTVVVLLTASSMTIGATSASGQTADTTTRRPDSTGVRLAPVEVHASIAPIAGPAVGSSVPARVSIVSRRVIDAWQPRTLADVLSSQAGVSVYDDLGSPYKLNLSMRGFNVGPTVGLPPGISVFLDGVRQNEPDAREVNFDLLPMEHVERVELLSGTASLLGPNSLGGAVNLVTRRGNGPLSGDLQATGGSFGTAGGQASVGGSSAGNWDYYASAGYQREEGWREATGARNYNGFVNIGRRGAVRGLSLQVYRATSRAETAGSLPESIFAISPQTNFTTGDFEDLDGEQLAITGYAPVGSGHGAFTGYVRRSRAERFNVNQPPDDNVRSRTSNGSVGMNADWRWSAARDGSVLAFRAGVDGAANRVRVRIFTEPAASPGVVADGDTLTTDIRSPSWDLAGYAIADARFGRVMLSGGLRYDHVRVPFDNQLQTTDRTTNIYRGISPRGGLSVDIGGGALAYASIGGSFRAPAILELGCADPEATCPLPFALGEDPPLDPVRATTYELGSRWARGSASVNATLYRTEVRNEVFFVASETALLSGYFTNIPRTRRDGAELAGQVGLLDDRVFGYANYAWTRATFQSAAEIFSIRADDDFADSPLAGQNTVSPGRRIPLTPDHQVQVGALARLPHGVELGMDTRYVGRQWLRGDEANETRSLDPYVLTNARLAIGLERWSVALLLNNATGSHRATFGTFNENRQTGKLERFLTPLNARTLRLVVRRGFGARVPDDGT